jgi:hypothetical protein
MYQNSFNYVDKINKYFPPFYLFDSFEKQVLEHFEFLPQKEVVSFNVGGQVWELKKM